MRWQSTRGMNKGALRARIVELEAQVIFLEECNDDLQRLLYADVRRRALGLEHEERQAQARRTKLMLKQWRREREKVRELEERCRALEKVARDSG